MRIVAPLVMVACCACGRIGFDPRGTGSGTGDGGNPGGDGALVDGSLTFGDGPLGQPVGLVTWFKLDENSGGVVYDAVKNEFGIVNGAMWAPGHAGSALQFVGNGDNVSVGAIPEISNLPQLSISAWINPANVTSDGQLHCVFAKATTTTAGWQVLVDAAGNGTFGFEAYYPTTRMSRHSPVGTLVAGQWQHVAMTWSGGSSGATVQLYVNGAPVLGGAATDAVGTRPDDSAISSSINCYGISGMAGVIDQIEIFDVVLSPQDVAALAAG